MVTLQAQLVELKVEIDQALMDERDERVRLARLIGTPSSPATWTLEPWTAPSHDLASESHWIDQALTHRPEVQSITWKLRALSDDEALARLMPWDGASAGVDLQRDDRLFAGPSLSTPIPVLDTGQARRVRVTSEQLEARHELTRARRKAVEEVRLAYQALSASTANLNRIRTELLPLQQSRRELAESSYRAGQSDVTAVFLAEQDLRAARAKAVEAERHAGIAMIRLQRAVGGIGVAASLHGAAQATDPASQPRMPHP
jgi:outer membrane protein TolC